MVTQQHSLPLLAQVYASIHFVAEGMGKHNDGILDWVDVYGSGEIVEKVFMFDEHEDAGLVAEYDPCEEGVSMGLDVDEVVDLVHPYTR